MDVDSSIAPDAAEEDVNPELEAIKAKQGKVTGIIIPPPEIRAVADKTAQFVARNGKSFEQKILSSGEGQTAKFNFMKPFDPYHAYYEFKIREFEETIANGGTIKPTTASATTTTLQSVPTTTTAPTTATTASITTTARATLMSPIAKFAMAKPSTTPSSSSSSSSDTTATSTTTTSFQPGAYEFSLGSPTGLSALDMDIIKLTAQYTAANGRDFLAGLAQREARNPQFDFLKPTHLLFSYFTTLVDAYAKILHPSVALKEKLKKTCDKMVALELAVNRWKFNKDEGERKRKENTDTSQEKIAFSNIDWFDFVVVETIDFPIEELVEYGNMTSGVNKLVLGNGVGNGSSSSSSSIISSSAATLPPRPPPPSTSATAATVKTTTITTNDDDEDMDMDMEDDEESGKEEDYNEKYKPKPSLPSSATTIATTASSSRGYLDTDEDNNQPQQQKQMIQEEEEDDVALKVVSDYRPRMAPSAASSAMSGTSGSTAAGSTAMTMLDPLSGRMIPVNEMSEHMRVALLDPKWRVEQQRFQEKQKETGFAEGSSIADSLKQFAKRRSDIFGGSGSGGSGGGTVSETDRARQLEEEEKERERVQWDGHQGSIAQAQQLQRDLMRRTPASAATSAATAATGMSGKPVVGPSLPGVDLSSITILSSPSATTAMPTTAVPIVPFQTSTATTVPPPPIPSSTPTPTLSVTVSLSPPISATTTSITTDTDVAAAITTTDMTHPPILPPTATIPLASPPPPPVAFIPPTAPISSVIPISTSLLPLVSPSPIPTAPLPSLPAPQQSMHQSMMYIQAPTTAVTQAPAKKPRTTADVSDILVPADEFAATHTGPVALQVVVPQDTTAQGKSWGFTTGTGSGMSSQQQVVSVTVDSVNITIKAVKELIAQKIKESGSGSESIPVSRFQLKIINNANNNGLIGVFLKDANTLATHNIGDDSFVLELSIKSRR